MTVSPHSLPDRNARQRYSREPVQVPHPSNAQIQRARDLAAERGIHPDFTVSAVKRLVVLGRRDIKQADVIRQAFAFIDEAADAHVGGAKRELAGQWGEVSHERRALLEARIAEIEAWRREMKGGPDAS